MNSAYEACLFDLYNTLVYFDEGEYLAKASLAASKCGLERDHFLSTWHSLTVSSNLGQLRTTADRVRRLLELTGRSPEEEVIQAVCSVEHDFLREKSRLYDDVMESLESLRRLNLKLGLVTNASASVREVLFGKPFYRLMDAIVISSDVGIRKPDVEIYRICLDRLGVGSGAALFVGDGDDHELEGAKRSGLTTAMILRQSFRPKAVDESASSSADYKLTVLTELAEIVATGRPPVVLS